MSNTVTPLTNGELSKLTGTPYYVIQYLDRLGKLPKEKESTGKGDPFYICTGSNTDSFRPY